MGACGGSAGSTTHPSGDATSSKPAASGAKIEPKTPASPSQTTPTGSPALEVAYDTEPKLLSMNEPAYPESARQSGTQGTVLVRVLVNEQGRVGDTIVIQSVPGLDDAAVKAVSTSVWEPARKNKAPVAVWMVVPIQFKLKG